MHVKLTIQTHEQQEEAKIRAESYKKELETYLETIRNLDSKAKESEFGTFHMLL
jgi:hypothetical protein